MYPILGILLVCLGASRARDTNKAFRSLPAISNSLVNLGKMDISFHFNTKVPEGHSSNLKSENYMHALSPFMIPPKRESVEMEPCPCSTLKNFKNPFLTNPSEMINKILKSSDLFSANQESVTSTMCCDSHEHIQEDTVFFEFNPRPHAEPITYPKPLSTFPMFVDNFLPKAPLSSSPNNKLKTIEIFFFPKKKEGTVPILNDFPKPSQPKKNIMKEIQIVGDKELRKDFKKITNMIRKEELEQTLFKPDDLTINEEKKDFDKTVTKGNSDKADKEIILENISPLILNTLETASKNEKAEKVETVKKIDEKKSESTSETSVNTETTKIPGSLSLAV